MAERTNEPPKVALVTGAGSGIGRGVALALAAKGVRVVINYPPGEEAGAEETGRQVGQMGGESLLVEADVSKPTAVHSMVDQVLGQWGAINILVNNAAVQPDQGLLEYRNEEFDWVIAVNVLGAVWCSQAVLEPMKRQGGGRIIHIVSVHAKRPTDFDPVYAMSKAALKMLTRESALELGKYQITVNAVAPGAVAIGQPKFGHLRPVVIPSYEPRRKLGPRRVNRMVLGRVGTPEDVGLVVAGLADDANAWMTGSVIRLDGGSMLG